MTYIRRTLRRFYNFVLTVRHRTGRTEQLLIAMNNDAHHRAHETGQSFAHLVRNVQNLKEQEKTRHEFLFQSVKTLERSLVKEMQAWHGQQKAAQAELKTDLQGHFQKLKADQGLRGDLLFQSQKNMEQQFEDSLGALHTTFDGVHAAVDGVNATVDRVSTTVDGLQTIVDDLRNTVVQNQGETAQALSQMAAMIKALQDAQAVQNDRIALQREREEFRFETEQAFQASLQTDMKTLKTLKTQVGDEQKKLATALSRVEQAQAETHKLLKRKDHLKAFAALFAEKGTKPLSIPKLKDVFHDYVEMVEEGETFKLWGYDVAYLDRKSLWIQLNELICRAEYYFSDNFDAPHRIIDGGANIGLSILFFKALYPNATVVAFEPNETCYKIAEENIRKNGLTGVTLLKAAVGPETGEATLYLNDQDSMGASLAPRHITEEMVDHSVTVPMISLREYLETPVDFLKLDIEGNEAEVLNAVADQLPAARNIFCEYHFSEEYVSRNKLRDIVDVLDDAGFDFQIAKSLWYGEHSEHRPMTYVGQDYSGVIYARKRADVAATTTSEGD